MIYMAKKKTQKKVMENKPKKPTLLSDKERASLRKTAEADMKKYGFKTVEELIAHYDKQRGY